MSGRAIFAVAAAAILFSVSTAFAEDSLVGWWEFEEGGGSTAGDSSGNGNDGTLVNGPVWTSGIIGGALEFDGTDDRVSVPDDGSLDISGAITVSIWLKMDSGVTSQSLVNASS